MVLSHALSLRCSDVLTGRLLSPLHALSRIWAAERMWSESPALVALSWSVSLASIQASTGQANDEQTVTRCPSATCPGMVHSNWPLSFCSTHRPYSGTRGMHLPATINSSSYHTHLSSVHHGGNAWYTLHRRYAMTMSCVAHGEVRDVAAGKLPCSAHAAATVAVAVTATQPHELALDVNSPAPFHRCSSHSTLCNRSCTQRCSDNATDAVCQCQ